MKKFESFKFWVQQVMPIVYDDSLSYYELLTKVINYLNDLGENVNELIDIWNGLDELIEADVREELNKMVEDGRLDNMLLDILGRYHPVDYLQSQHAFSFVNNTENGEPDFIQGFVFNIDRNECYVVRKDNTQANNIIYRYDMETWLIKDSKRFATSTGCYNEGLPYFYNDSGQLMFIVRTSYDHTVAIFNYDTGELTPNFVVQGSSKHGMDNKGKYYFTHFGDAERVEGVFLYDFDSVKNQTPELIQKIYFPTAIADGEKIQSITMIDDYFYCGHGKQFPEISVINLYGDVIKHHAFDKQSLMNMINESYPEVNLNNYQYENEGITWYQEGNKTFVVMGHMIGETNKTYFARLGNPTYFKVDTKNYKRNLNNSMDWKDVTSWGEGVASYGGDVAVQYAKDDKGMVYLRGVVTYPRPSAEASVVGFNKVLFTLPYPYQPYRHQWFRTVASGGADKANRVCVRKGGEVVLESYFDQGGTGKPFCSLDNIQFYVDTRPK
jgi:hypothetical protein